MESNSRDERVTKMDRLYLKYIPEYDYYRICDYDVWIGRSYSAGEIELANQHMAIIQEAYDAGGIHSRNECTKNLQKEVDRLLAV